MDTANTDEQIVWTDILEYDAVGPIMRSGEIAEAVIDALCEDNPGKPVYVTDRGDYLHIHIIKDCRLTRDTLSRCLGRNYELARLEIEMPAFTGRMRTSDSEYRWYYVS